MKKQILSLALASAAFAAFAQTTSIPTPASSAASGGRAIVAITPLTAGDVTNIVNQSISDGSIGGGGAAGSFCGYAEKYLSDNVYTVNRGGWEDIALCNGVAVRPPELVYVEPADRVPGPKGLTLPFKSVENCPLGYVYRQIGADSGTGKSGIKDHWYTWTKSSATCIKT